MVFWAIAAVMTAAVTLAVLRPLLVSRVSAAPSRAEHDVEVYRAQLRELDGDLDRGTVTPADAQSARAEIGRRLLRAAEGAASEARSGRSAGAAPRLAAIAVAVLVPAVGFLAYSGFGAAGMPDLPLLARAGEPAPGAAPQGDAATLVAGAEEKLRQNPDDGRGWDVLAPIYLRLDRPGDAATAFRNAIRLNGSSAARQAGLGEALTQLSGGEVTNEAKAAFEAALADNPGFLPAKFFLALDASQENRLEDAESAWSGLVAESPDGAPWLTIADAALADARRKLGRPAEAASPPAPAPAPAAAAPGPDAVQVATAAAMPQAERRAMIEGMVSQLAMRLEAAPNDVEGWKRLIRSYGVLGEADKARAALASAGTAFAPDSTEAREIAALGREMGLTAGEETTR
ncbi:c-type cytochrome biogenesis protein CcmI [Aurantimonas sp. Leaf443]|uniref:c-type cytochrome biogenesis protein CcmI n=1 Tax=Aurantimonas sp. Leaf443 TaxID=1736378 RepID=UPI0006F453F9|nr:c-type cytochrome biogenesis protein CcmI [Aurantimonas sp. Leaf443]KQT88247.1 cytochrome C biogenesis protein CycH [Aurantimonas sp. Leaf443]